MNERIVKLRRVLKRLNADSLIVSNPSNIFYLSGFAGNDSLLFVTHSLAYIITDFRYKEEAQICAGEFSVIHEKGSLYEKAAYIIKKDNLRSIGFEAHYMTVRDKDNLACLSKARFMPTEYIIEKLRMIKEAREIDKIRASAFITRKTFKMISKDIKPGIYEKDIAYKIDFYIRTFGADRPSFDTIVLSGACSSMPHGKPAKRKIGSCDSVMIDFGARLNGYSSDLTRMVFVGKISQYLNIIYSIVKTAQKKAIDRIRPGIKISEIDKTARSYIDGKGFGKYFGHATGHGIGIDVHEFPSINFKNNDKLKAGMVFSVEPGIYIPGKLGIRMEDMVVVTEKGCEVLTR
jgi:Xaa-Pro aminopeptidase